MARLRTRLLIQEQRSRQQIEQILESITDAFYALDFSWRLTYVNQVMARDLNMSVAELLGKNIWEVFPLAVGSPAYHALHYVMTVRKPMQFETINYRGNHWLEVSAHPAENGISVYYRDISQRIKAERWVSLLQEVTAALTAAYTLDQVADVIVSGTLSAIEADHGAIGLVSKDGQHIEMLRQEDFLDREKPFMRLVLKSGSDLLSDTILRGEPLWFCEQREITEAYPSFADPIRNDFGIFAIASLPLRTFDEVIGAMILVFSKPRHFEQDEQTFLMTLADYCAQALERAQLYEAEQQARQKTEAIAERLKRLQTLIIALSGAKTRQDIYDVVLNQAIPAVGASAGNFMLLNPDKEHIDVVADRGYVPEIVESWRRFPANLKAAMVVQAIQTRDLFLLRSIQERDIFMNHQPVESAHKAWASLPLMIKGEAIGALGFSFTEEQEFGEADQEFMRTLAEQCSQAMERVNLYETQQAARIEAERAALRTARLQLITAQLADSLTPQEIADVILDEGLQAINARAGSVSVVSKDKKTLEVIQMKGYSAEFVKRWQFIPLDNPNSPLASAIHSQEPIWLNSPAERLIQNFAPGEEDEVPEFNAWAAIPLMINGECIGALGLSFTEPQEFDSKQRGFALALADQCAQSLERNRLHNAAREAAALEERQRLARDLHDSVSQVLFSATNTAEAIPRLWNRNPKRGEEELQQLVMLNRAAMAEMRALLLELRPEAIVRTPLKQLLEQLARAVPGRKTATVEVIFNGDPELYLRPEAHVAFYRIAQEAINNVVKHSNCTNLIIRLEDAPDICSLEISDNGLGFDMQRTTMGMGTNTMRERALEIGGIFNIGSIPGQGTQVTLRWKKR